VVGRTATIRPDAICDVRVDRTPTSTATVPTTAKPVDVTSNWSPIAFSATTIILYRLLLDCKLVTERFLSGRVRKFDTPNGATAISSPKTACVRIASQ
jgi:hypothetical protein